MSRRSSTTKTKIFPGYVCGKLTVQHEALTTGLEPQWVCLCSCGNTTTVGNTSLEREKTHSCGCLSRIADPPYDNAVKLAFFLLKGTYDGREGCWLWSEDNPQDSGYFYVGGRCYRAHRVSYLIHHGTLEPGIPVNHLCAFQGCVNPTHLQQGMSLKADPLAGKKFVFEASTRKGVRLTYADAETIRFKHGKGQTVRSLAAEYGFTEKYIDKIITKEVWKPCYHARVSIH